MEEAKPQKHFVLVHGACHGAWSWYKLKVQLETAGHRVTAVELSASGINTKTLKEVRTLHDYTLPLLETMAAIPPTERVILVGHSLGGLSLALAMDTYPHKVAVSVFVTAFMPDTSHLPSYVLDQYLERTPPENWLDTQFSSCGSMLFGPKFLALKLYQLSPPEDLALASTLVRPGSLFLEDLSKASPFSEEGYGSVKRVYIVCSQDKGITDEFQSWMIQNYPVAEVKEIKDSDHMPMFSHPQQLCQSLLHIAQTHA